MSSELKSDVCYRVYGWRHLVKATEVTAAAWRKVMAANCRVDGLVACGLTACTPGSAPCPTLGNYVQENFTFFNMHA